MIARNMRYVNRFSSMRDTGPSVETHLTNDSPESHLMQLQASITIEVGVVCAILRVRQWLDARKSNLQLSNS